MAAGGKAINLGELAIAIALKTGALEAGLKEVQNKLKDHGKKVQATGADYDKLAIVAGVAFWKIASAISGGVKAFNDFNNSMVGLKSIVQGTGNDFGKAQQFIDGFIKDGLVPANNAAMALKNLLSRGFGMDQAADMLNRLKDSAAFARQGSLTMGEAIQGATEGLKNENSVLVDNAGVTKNVSIMWKEYAATIGKGADSLTQAEKVIAEYNGIMKETQHQVGDAAKYSDQFAGAQSRMTFETTKLKQAFGGALVPALNAFLSILTPVISFLTTLVKNNPELVAALALTATAFLGIITAVTAVGAAINMITPALAALKLSLGALMLNPIVLALTALAVVGGIVASQIIKAKKAQDDYNAALEKFNKIKTKGVTKAEVPQLQEQVTQLKELSRQYDEAKQKVKQYNEEVQNAPTNEIPVLSQGTAAMDKLEEYTKKLISIKAQMKELGVTEDDIRQKTKLLEKAIDEANRVTAEEYSARAKVIAQDQATVSETQNLINAYKSATKGSQDWYDAQQKLADQYPQFSTASGIKIKAIQDEVTAKQDAVTKEWTLLQSEILMTKLKVQAMLSEKTAALALVEADKKALESDRPHNVSKAWQEKDKQYRTTTIAVNDLKTQLGLLDNLLSMDPKDIPGIKPPDGSGISAYENAVLDSAVKIHDHKVAMEQLTKEQELADLKTILKAYAKTADERMSLEEKIFSVKQEIRDRDLAATQKAIDDEAKKLADRTSNSINWIDKEKSQGNLTGQEEIDAYNRIIKYHKEYIAKIVADTNIGQDEKNKIIAEETKTIQEQQDKILAIQKSTVEKAVNAYIDAKRKQYDTEESLENNRLNKKLKDLDKEYSDKENALKAADRNNELSSLYEEERKYQNAATKEGQDKLKDIRSQIASLNQEAAQDSLAAEKESRQAAIEQEVEDNRNKYKKLNEDLEIEKNNMVAAAVDYAQKANDAIVSGHNAIANSLANVMKSFDIQTTDMITKGMESLKKLIEGYKKIMDNISLSPSFQLAGAGGINVNAAANGVKTNSVVINDYGNKILSGIEEIQDYGKELVTGANNALG